MKNEGETNINKNIIVKTIENDKVLKWSGITTTSIALLEILLNGSNISEQEHALIIAVGIIGIVAAAVGDISGNINRAK